VQYLTAEDILVIHAKLIDEIGGSHGVRDVNLLISLTERPKTSFSGKEVYRTVFEKAAAYLESLVKYHVFVDGNKRTAVAVSARFLFMNGYELTATNKELEKFTLKVVIEKLVLEKIAGWLKIHSRKTS